MITNFYKLLQGFWNRISLPSKLKVKFCGINARFFVKKLWQQQQHLPNLGGEDTLLQPFTKSIKDTDIVLDCGGFRGLYTIFAALKAKNGRVFVVEPDPGCCQIIKKNIRLNHLSNVQILSSAILNNNNHVSLAVNEKHGWSSRLSSLLDNIPSSRQYKNLILVQGIKFDDLISKNNLSETSVLKVDIEGAEAFIFNKKWKSLVGKRKFAPRVIFLEIHPLYISQFGSSAGEIDKIILSSGYKCILSEKRTNEIHKIYQLK